MAWQQLTLSIPASELPRTEALLRLAGASSIAISDSGDVPILEPEPGTTPLWPDITVRALFADNADLTGLGAILGTGDASDLRIEPISADDLERALRQAVERVEIGPRLAVVPAGSLDPDSPRELGLHMGLAFGTGQHPTTRLCLEWLERDFTGPADVLDYGCGTGVLALAALRLGARHALAIDIEPQALEATRRNAALNGLEASLSIGAPDALETGPFELILANILAEPLIGLAGTFADLQGAGDTIVLSGILTEQQDAVESHYARWYERFDRYEAGGWGLLTARRRRRYDR